MKTNVPVSSIMTENTVQLNLTDALCKAEKLFKKHQIRHLPVVEGGKVVGIFSTTDLEKISTAELNESEQLQTLVYNEYTLEQVMSKCVVTLPKFAPIQEAAALLATNQYRVIPIVYEEKLVGIVTTTDVINYFLTFYK